MFADSPSPSGEGFGEELAAVAQTAGVDAVCDAEREMPLGGDRRFRQRVGGHEHRLEGNELILIAVDEQNRRRLTSPVAGLRLPKALGADEQAGKSQDGCWRERPAQTYMQRHHRSLAESDQSQLRIIEAKPAELRIEKRVDGAARLDGAVPALRCAGRVF